MECIWSLQYVTSWVFSVQSTLRLLHRVLRPIPHRWSNYHQHQIASNQSHKCQNKFRRSPFWPLYQLISHIRNPDRHLHCKMEITQFQSHIQIVFQIEMFGCQGVLYWSPVKFLDLSYQSIQFGLLLEIVHSWWMIDTISKSINYQEVLLWLSVVHQPVVPSPKDYLHWMCYFLTVFIR